MQTASPSLTFAKSHSEAVGVNSSLLPVMERYAPRISSVLKLTTYGTMISSGISTFMKVGLSASPVLMIAAGDMLIGSAMILIAYGDKEKQKHHTTTPHAPPPTDAMGRIFYEFGKVFSPADYPIDAASGLQILSATMIAAAGALMLPPNPSYILMGLAGGISSAIALFGKERAKPKETLPFGQSQSQMVGSPAAEQGVFQNLKDNPMQLASIISVATAGYNLYNGIRNDDLFVSIISGLAILSNAITGLFVHKNDYNADAANRRYQPQPQLRSVAPLGVVGDGMVLQR